MNLSPSITSDSVFAWTSVSLKVNELTALSFLSSASVIVKRKLPPAAPADSQRPLKIPTKGDLGERQKEAQADKHTIKARDENNFLVIAMIMILSITV